jgi:Fic family protein
MKRGLTGRYEVTTAGGENVRAFVPHPLPPSPPLDLRGPLQPALERALLAVGRLDSVSELLPDMGLFLYAYVRKEAVLSSQIEGTQSSLSDLLLFEAAQAPGVPLDDVVEVSNYVAALEHGLARLREGFPLSARLIREIHAKLLSSGRGIDKDPGEFRRTQNWVGGSRPGNAIFVPPPHTALPGCVSDFERFLHDDADNFPVLVKAALAHVQFETIHPFLDGNGRVGRLLITFLLCHANVLRQPLLYLSLYFKQNRAQYYQLLESTRQEGDWEEWVSFFLEGVAQTGDGAVATARRLVELIEKDRARIQTTGRRAGSTLRVHDALAARPVIRLQEASQRANLSFPATTTGMDLLAELGIAREVTGKKRNRIFAYDRYLAILSEGTEVTGAP